MDAIFKKEVPGKKVMLFRTIILLSCIAAAAEEEKGTKRVTAQKIAALNSRLREYVSGLDSSISQKGPKKKKECNPDCKQASSLTKAENGMGKNVDEVRKSLSQLTQMNKNLHKYENDLILLVPDLEEAEARSMAMYRKQKAKWMKKVKLTIKEEDGRFKKANLDNQKVFSDFDSTYKLDMTKKLITTI